MRAAALGDLARKKALRKFLFDFANEEELHYLVAAGDLARMGLPILAEPFDVTLWHAYFRSIVDERPFIRLGAACVLENLAGGEARAETRAALAAPKSRSRPGSKAGNGDVSENDGMGAVSRLLLVGVSRWRHSAANTA
jgi:hypothetical protein